MSTIENKKPTFPRLYTIHSQKGGVGKTSIAVAIAGFAAIAHGKKTLIIDADLTGTSLIDIPSFSPNGLTKNKSYFNDLILANPADFARYTPIIQTTNSPRKKRYLNKFYHDISIQDCDKISYFPASPDLSEIRKTIPLISQEDHLLFFRLRLEDIIVTAMMDGFEVIIIDHPPGLYGISTASLKMVLDQQDSETKEKSRLSKLIRGSLVKGNQVNLSCHSILCTTSDPVDYKAVIPSLSMLLGEKWGKTKKWKEKISDDMKMDVFLNKAVKEKKHGWFDSAFVWKGILDELKTLPEKNNFKEFPDSRKVNCDLLDTLEERIKETGAGAGEHIKDFSMDMIFPAIKKLKQLQDKKPSSEATMENWCYQLGNTVKLLQFIDSNRSQIQEIR
ncbi:MAG: ParA family protein [Candidatus Aenigmarchaeota archaeon]|nr:ParA family protein [Candidatus Aenigmarchaeota archaeon]